MAYEDVTSDADVAALISDDVATEIITGVEETSAVMKLMRNTRMSKGQQRMPVLSALPQVGFVAGGGGLKPITKLAWQNKFLVAEELAAIVVVPDAYIDDSDFPIWEQVRPKLVEGIAMAVDAAVLFGIDKPDTWGKSVYQHAVDAGNQLTRGSVAGQDVAGDASDIMSLVETDGFDVNGFAARRSFRGSLRNLRDDNGQPIFQPNMQDKTKGMLWGEDLNYVAGDGWNSAVADLLTGDWQQGVIAIRQDITFKKLTESALFDNEGNLIVNLAQQDMTGLRVVIRLAYQIANSVNREGTITNQSPFAVLHPIGFTP